jgi:hypothetical protein
MDVYKLKKYIRKFECARDCDKYPIYLDKICQYDAPKSVNKTHPTWQTFIDNIVTDLSCMGRLDNAEKIRSFKIALQKREQDPQMILPGKILVCKLCNDKLMCAKQSLQGNSIMSSLTCDSDVQTRTSNTAIYPKRYKLSTLPQSTHDTLNVQPSDDSAVHPHNDSEHHYDQPIVHSHDDHKFNANLSVIESKRVDPLIAPHDIKHHTDVLDVQPHESNVNPLVKQQSNDASQPAIQSSNDIDSDKMLHDLNQELFGQITKDQPKDQPMDQPMDLPNDLPRDQPKDQPMDAPKNVSFNISRDTPTGMSKDVSFNTSRDTPTGMSEDVPHDTPNDIPHVHPYTQIKLHKYPALMAMFM